MSESRRRAAEIARRARVAGVRRVRGVGAAAQRRLGRTAYTPGLLSLVVPMYNVEDYIDECLVSLREQHYGHVEIVVVDDGSGDGSRAIAERHAAADRRVRIVTRPNGGLSAARNTGVEAAVGEFLAFVDADDRVAPDAYSLSVASLCESGSDFAVFYYQRLFHGTLTPSAPWLRAAHAEPRIGVDLDSFPDAMVNAVAWSKVYRRAFYDAAELTFPVGLIYEDQALSMRAFARAKAFDVLPHSGVEWRMRENATSITQQHAEVGNIVAHNVAMASSLEELRSAGKPAAVRARALQLLDNNLQFFKRNAVYRNEEYWRHLREAVTMLLGEVSREDYIENVGAYKKLLDELIREDRMDDAISLLLEEHPRARRHRTSVRGDDIYLELGPRYAHLPEECFRLSRTETKVRARAGLLRWEPEGRLRIEGWAVLSNIDLTDEPSEIRLSFVAKDGRELPLRTTVRSDLRANMEFDYDYCDYTNGGFVAEIDAADIPDDVSDWRLDATVTRDGRSRTTGLVIYPWTEASLLTPVVDRPGRSLGIGSSRAGLVYLRVRTSPVTVVARDSGEGWAQVDLAGPVARLHATFGKRGQKSVPVQLSNLPDGITRARLDLSRAPAGAVIRLDATTTGGEEVAVLDHVDEEIGVKDLTRPWFGRSRDGRTKVRMPGPHGEIVAVDVDEREVVVELDIAPATGAAQVGLRGLDGVFQAGVTEKTDGTRHVVRIPLSRPGWDGETRVLPTGAYALVLAPDPADSGKDIRPRPSLALNRVLPDERLFESVLVRAEVFEPRQPGLRFMVEPPLTVEERSSFGQRVLRQQDGDRPADQDSVFFRTLYGEVTNGNCLGVHEELRRRGTGSTFFWAVTDHSVAVPDGGTPVVELSRAWHEAMRRSRYHMVDVHQLDWFERPEGQVLIETMHGYPYKVMGHEWWSKGAFPPDRVHAFDRRARDWTHFVSPATYATPLLKSAFLDPAGATPEILEIGYPRNDVLFSEEAVRIRERTRERLGIGPDEVAVMYAPTFRDYLSPDDMTAARVDFFDPHAAAGQLAGDARGFVFLMRGHAFNARVPGEREREADRVRDVTDYPDVNDLILASDVAVLDYSSLRFDYALTDKPMIFLVPDLEEYDAARGGVLPFAPTAPGPHVRTTAEVVAQLRDVAALDTAYAEARAGFRAAYADIDDGHAGERLVDAVFVPRGDAPPSVG